MEQADDDGDTALMVRREGGREGEKEGRREGGRGGEKEGLEKWKVIMFWGL